MTGTGAQESLNGRRCRSYRKDLPCTNPVIPAAGRHDLAGVAVINYVAQRLGYDTEECIRMALEDGYIELYHRNQHGYREYDTYRLTAKGRKARDEHTREVFQRSSEVAKRIKEEKERRNGSMWPAMAVPSGRPPLPAAGELPPELLHLQKQVLGGLSAARTLAHRQILPGSPVPARHDPRGPPPVIARRRSRVRGIASAGRSASPPDAQRGCELRCHAQRAQRASGRAGGRIGVRRRGQASQKPLECACCAVPVAQRHIQIDGDDASAGHHVSAVRAASARR